MKKAPLTAILLIAFVDLVGFGLIIPLQAVYAERLGATGLVLGLLIGVYALAQLVFNPILGRWSDHVGRRRVLLISVAGSVFSHLLLGVADLSHSLPLLFVARILDGITGANIATAQAYIADVTTPENRAKGMGMFGAAFGLGFVVGPALGAGLAFVGSKVSGPDYGTAWPAFGAAIISFVAFILVWRLLPESKVKSTDATRRFQILNLAQLRRIARQPRLRELLIVVFGATFAFVLLEATFVYLCSHKFGTKETGTGLIFAYIGIMMVIVQGGMLGKLVKRHGELNLLAVGPFFTALGFLLLSVVPLQVPVETAWVLLLLGCVPVAIGQGITGPNANALISRHTEAHELGGTLGLAQSVGSLARAIGPPIGGLLYDIRASWPYWVGALLLFSTGVWGLSIRAAQRRSLETHES